ncbi:hypothetical protein IFM89_033681 [Coptis chinensis]|uniref:Bidirectional sugar transporter SWEET n=1 Tax=Coptis chinensis TaxID=261450 RepID=A0A835HIQ9_9MAGN|nr:hypothetical protein IFM89_033681 [Coptis chinensis]
MAGVVIFHPLDLVFGVLGVVLTFFVYLAPVPIFYKIHKRKATEGFQAFPYIISLLNCMLWVYYSLLAWDIYLLTINTVGCLLRILFIAVHTVYAPRGVGEIPMRFAIGITKNLIHLIKSSSDSHLLRLMRRFPVDPCSPPGLLITCDSWIGICTGVTLDDSPCAVTSANYDPPSTVLIQIQIRGLNRPYFLYHIIQLTGVHPKSKWPTKRLLSVAYGIHIRVLHDEAFLIVLFHRFTARLVGTTVTEITTAKLVVLLNVVLYALIFLLTLLLAEGSKRVHILGWICVVSGISVFAAPLSILRQVLQTRSVEYMPFGLSLFLTLSAAVWSAYGVLLGDVYVTIPSALGVLLGLAQIALYVAFRESST